ncbi:MAG: OadG family protein [Candidatus Kapabacteria bacterium]|nr:OadG family protein [Candidatus Kapabacteria bacterium]
MFELDRILYALELTVVGMSSVFLILIFFACLIWFMKYIDAVITKTKTKKSKIGLQPIPEISIDDDDELIAVITAAIQMTISNKASIKNIQFLGQQNQEGNWAAAGRLNVMSSHNLNKRN